MQLQRKLLTFNVDDFVIPVGMDVEEYTNELMSTFIPQGEQIDIEQLKQELEESEPYLGMLSPGIQHKDKSWDSLVDELYAKSIPRRGFEMLPN